MWRLLCRPASQHRERRRQEAVRIASLTGGRTAAVFESLAAMAREETELAGERAAAAAQARLSAAIVAGIPWRYWQWPGSAGDLGNLVAGGLAGMVMVALGIGLLATGSAWVIGLLRRRAAVRPAPALIVGVLAGLALRPRVARWQLVGRGRDGRRDQPGGWRDGSGWRSSASTVGSAGQQPPGFGAPVEPIQTGWRGGSWSASAPGSPQRRRCGGQRPRWAERSAPPPRRCSVKPGAMGWPLPSAGSRASFGPWPPPWPAAAAHRGGAHPGGDRPCR